MKNFYYYKYYWILKVYEGELGFNYISAIIIFTTPIILQSFTLINLIFFFSDVMWFNYFLTENGVLNRFVVWPIVISPFFVFTLSYYFINKKEIHKRIQIYKAEGIDSAKKNGRRVKWYMIITFFLFVFSLVTTALVKHEIRKRKKIELGVAAAPSPPLSLGNVSDVWEAAIKPV